MSIGAVKPRVPSVGSDASPARGAKSPFRPGRGPARELERRIADEPADDVGDPPASETDVLLDAWRARIELERTGARRTAPPAPAAAMVARPDKPVHVRDPLHHSFAGSVSVSVGPFRDLDEVGEFADILALVHGVGSVRVRTFEGQNVVYEVALDEPTRLVGELRVLSPRVSKLLHANDRVIRLTFA